jgi:hypothetical protein
LSWGRPRCSVSGERHLVKRLRSSLP